MKVGTVAEETASRQNVRTTGREASNSSVRSKSSLFSKFSINETTTHRWSFLEDVTAYCEAGVGGIGVWRPKLVQFGEERGIELIRDTGLPVSSVSWAGGFTGWDGYSFQDAIDDARDAIRVAGELNANCLVVVSGSRCGHTANHARDLLLDALDILAEDAEEHGLTLAIQPMQTREWSFLSSLDETLDVLNQCNHPSVRMAFDVCHLWREPELLSRIPELAPLVSVVQLSDWQKSTGSKFDQLLPGDGVVPLEGIVDAFLDAKYDGFFEFKVWSEELWDSSYSQLLGKCRSRFRSLCCR